jgi:hypothetical protein
VGRYIQYRATINQASGISPSLDRVEIGYEIDAVAPIAAIDDVVVAGDTATVRFSSTDLDVDRFDCRLGTTATFVTCASPHRFTGLGSGSHTALVRAVDAAGNLGPVVGRQFTVPAAPSRGGGPGSTADESDPPVALDATAPRVRLLTRSARVTAAGLVAVRIRCLGDEVRCRLTVRMEHGRTRSARKTVSVAGGKAATVRLRLSTATRSVLAARTRLKVTAVVTARDLAGNVRTVRRNVMLSSRGQARALGICAAC